MKTKEEIATKHGIINGFTIHSNPAIAQRNLFEAMQEYAEAYHDQFKEPVTEAEKIDLLNEIINNQHKLMVNAEKRGYDKAMEEYATHSANVTVSDEDIEKYFTAHHYDNKNGNHYRIKKDRIFGAKAYRDGKIKPAEGEKDKCNVCGRSFNGSSTPQQPCNFCK